MADAEDVKEDEAKTGPGLKLWLGVLVLAAALGGGGFYATYSGLLAGPSETAHADDHGEGYAEGPQFVELDPLQISVGGEGSIRQLRFRAYLQLGEGDARAVTDVQPRILDIFSTYLRALPPATLEDPTALLRVRSQLLRRVQLLTGPDAVDDLLIIDFVIA
ncbi:MAG: flagellar basal body-associated FliL family protein [Pseudomonadota bacterium]